jgi:nitronate monooxygenase
VSRPFPYALRLPVVVAPMFLVSSPELVVEACRAGVIGSFPTQNCRTVEELDVWMQKIVSGLKKSGHEGAPWAVNLVTHSTNARLPSDLELIARYRPPMVITALGSPQPVMQTVKAYGGLVFADVITLRLAHKAAQAGVDGMACICAGAGGHTGSLSPLAFVSAVREFFDGWIAVGGGIGDGAGIAGALAAGADLVYMGTRFIPSTESLAQPEYKQMVVDHGPDDLTLSAAITGNLASWLKPSLRLAGLDPDNLTAQQGQKDYTPSAQAQTRWKDLWAAGQGLQTSKSVQPTAEIVEELARGYDEAIRRFRRLTEGR